MERTRRSITDEAISRICTRDLVITAQTAATEGIDDRALIRRATGGSLRQILRGVYCPTISADDINLRLAAAAAWAPDAVFADRTALWLHKLGPAPEVIHLACTTGRRSTVPWLHVRRTRDLPDIHVRELGSYRITAIYRTLMDACAYMDDDELEDLLDEAWRRGKLSPGRLEQHCLASGKAHRGTARLIKMARDRQGHAPTDSKLEARAVKLIRRAKIKQPQRQVVVRDAADKRIGRMDLVYAEERLIVECDSRRHHAGAAFDTDRGKWGRAQTAGYRIQWATWRNTEGDGKRFLEELRENLRERARKLTRTGS